MMKVVLHACPVYSLTFGIMKKIISGLVDVESKNNDNDLKISESVDAKVAKKYLRLVSPKCEDYILRCEINGQRPPCTDIFKSVVIVISSFSC